ncbi:hypothetical protein IW261DRAFT_1424182 [Armillaria novae-zelandiae]|uniref:CxC2-like cysteine cluster KDZ transposase-associated domain-containing protein n=1 Tax=Armillaria novae-zelandiae TaxID=153914 RepID=A0AA39NVD5_9AGAR|nr:hypothetical protein IW261DRAFT_1424182 [Armillaria novae-zelandiae]
MNFSQTNEDLTGIDYDNLNDAYHLDPQAYTLTMARDMEDASMVPRMKGKVMPFPSRTVVVLDVRIQILPTIVSHVGMQDCSVHIPLGSNSLAHYIQALECCSHEHLLAIQLQHAWLFPGTMIEPRMAVTMVALEQFQMLTFMGKILAYEYYHSLARLSDNTGTSTPSEWSFIHLLKQAGIRNNAGGWKVAEPVSCMVDCLACPHPGVNIPVKVDPDLPDAWEDTLFVGVDANFKLERFEVSSEEKDPGLGSGLGYFVDTTSFKNHLKMFNKHILQAQSTGNDHKAAKPDKKTHA